VKTEEVTFYSGGAKIAATWRTPDTADGRIPAVVQGPGWLGLRGAKLYLRYHEALTAAGIGVLVIDYRGFGDSEGDPTILSFEDQVEDLWNAVTYLTTRDDVDPDAIGTFGSGGSGASNSIVLAARDPRIKAVVAQVPISDAVDWLKRMRPEHAWQAFLEELAEDERNTVTTGESRLVDPREDLTPPTPERRATTVKKDVDKKVGRQVQLRCVPQILRYRPLDAATGLRTPLQLIAVEGDTMTPADHSEAMFEAASGPKEFILQRHTTHYAAYDQYGDEVIPRIVDWFTRYVARRNLVIRTENT
jgi:dipeptidyl aminopeptidase/acylaminoacyl peptidase